MATGVGHPSKDDERYRINEQLIKIKSERADHSISSYDSSDSNDMSQVYPDMSQAPRPQQFYQDLDAGLSGLARRDFINELLTLCYDEYDRVNDYRYRLAERARGFPECPQSRLVNRRNSPNATKLEKCANDCYIIHAFINGVRSREINEPFSINSNTTLNESVMFDTQVKNEQRQSICSEHPQRERLLVPDLAASMIKVQADIAALTKKQNQDSDALQQILTNTQHISGVMRTIHGT